MMKNTARIFAISYLMAMVGLQACNVNYSDGDRAGTITKFSRKGITCKTWEGELVMGGFRQTSSGNESTVVANIFKFSVRDSDQTAIQKIKDAQISGKPVVLHYTQVLMSGICAGETDYFITDVTTVKQ